MRWFFTLILISICSVSGKAQQKKIITATRIETPPTIDGFLDDAVWLKLPSYSDFFMYEPGNEGKIARGYETEVKMAYDDKAVYFYASMKDPDIENIASQFSQRDDVFVQTDHISVALNTYNDGINRTHFFVTSDGTIGDAKESQNNFDFGYDVVFDAKTSKDENGWYAEYRIPYNALRFPEVEVQNWSVNFYRRLINRNETYTWSFINRKVGSESQYDGTVVGVTDIDPPVRLTLFPFAQGTVGNFDGNTETDFSAGMDIKYGLTDSFTLDATLIPDFGQTTFDNVKLNLGPFEQTFNENRQFFTEGVDLFNKGNIFFSRRIGSGATGNIGGLNNNEQVEEYPNRINLLNAIKISGRTENQLGVGFLNAITEKSYATIRNSKTGDRREVLVEPLSNYNVFVLDQQFNGNSSISLINTNVTRDGSFRDSNVSAFVFDVADRQNTFGASGRAIFSNVNQNTGIKSGFASEIDIARIKGNFRYRIGHDFANTTYDINDLGLNLRNNINDFVAGISYEIFEPTKLFNKYRFEFTARHRRLYEPSVQTGNVFSLESFFVTRSRFAFGLNFEANSKNQDYFEPRVPGRFVTYNPNVGTRGFVSSDYRKKFAYDIETVYIDYVNSNLDLFSLKIAPRYRFSNKLFMIFSSEYQKIKNDYGFIGKTDKNIFFGQRNITEVENSLTASYNFDSFKAIDLRFRNNWSTADYSYNIFSTLNLDGSLTNVDYDISQNNPNRNFNIWNLDLSFRWRFAPGSTATLLYRNQIFKQDNQATLSYGNSLQNLFGEPQQNTVSLRITYFIDYNNITYLFNKSS